MELVCPICASSTRSDGPPDAVPCPSCGRVLTADDAAESIDPAVEDEALVAELRDAFASGAYTLEAKPLLRTAGSGHSSDAFAGGLKAGSLPAGTRLADFEIVDELGRGGMGIVYRARQLSLNRQVALKVLPAGRHAAAEGTNVSRFRTEAQAAARLHHTNIVPVYAQGECDEGFYYAMELIEGASLDHLIRHRTGLTTASLREAAPSGRTDPAALTTTERSLRDAKPGDRSTVEVEPPRIRRSPADYRYLARLMAEVADGLEHAHQNGVIHRDIKPHNLLFGQDDRLHIADFGLARLLDQPHLTMVGDVMGTPAYLSPEQVRAEGGEVDHRTDVYSLGVTLYELITWRRPFRGQTREQIISGICSTEPEPPRRLDRRIPIDLETVCLRAMEKDVGRRFPSAAAMAEDLRRFAEGRPILSRRIGPIGKAVKWAGRHRAATAAIVSSAAVLLLIVGLGVILTANRRREADRLIESAYHRIVHLDHRKPERVLPDVDRAEQLGADPLRVNLVRALAGMQAEDLTPVIEGLDAILADEPDNVEALYTLARAQWHHRQYEESRQTFQRAEDLGGAQTAEEWLFRGLAVHYEDTPEAIASYRMARQLRADEGEFFPTAVLHLARAHNQQMYRTRQIDTFDEARRRLLELVDNGYYESYPYYLLSISYRLAAEIYSGSQGARQELAAEYYDEALNWARLGQEQEPTNDRPVTAEAEALESMGQFDAAIEARSRALELARPGLPACEQRHYRWRLHYWQGNFDQALADLEGLAECPAPEGRFYSHVYPLLVHAESGNMDAALNLARDLAPVAAGDAQQVLWSATCLRLLGRADEARQLLDKAAEGVDFSVGLDSPQTAEWVRALYAFARGAETADNLRALADAADDSWKLLAEMDFHAGAMALAAGDRDAARSRFLDAYRAFDGEQRYTYHVRILWQKLLQEPDWPPWIPATLVEASDPREDQGEEDGSLPAIRHVGEGKP
ncbi:MAG TPA: protein kinase [Phycisphaerae bacterium]|nr:protein kinase [Phycisphaerae bacterium]